MKRLPAPFDEAHLERMRWVSSLWVALLVVSAAVGGWERSMPLQAAAMADGECGASRGEGPARASRPR